MVMTSTAIYPALDPARPAALSRAVTTDLLRGDMGFTGVTITDALDTPALAAVGGTGAVAVRAVAAGNDLLIHSGFDNGVTGAAAIARAIRRGTLDRGDAQAAVARLLAFRERLGS
jgi:beta-N-acetylhexosaminidase